MLVEIRIPPLPESVTEATLAVWRKKPGEYVERDETLADIETDKVVFELPAPQSGVLARIARPEGATVLGDEVIGAIDTEAKAAHKKLPNTGNAKTSPVPGPAVRKLIAEHGLDAQAITGSGPGSRITKSDVLKHLEQLKPVPEAVAEKPIRREVMEGRPERRVPMTRLRVRVAQRLMQAQHNAAILTTFNEVDMQPVQELRARHKDRFRQEHGIKLGLMAFFVKACVEALQKYPVVNASIDGNDVVYHGYFDIGIAIGSARGLVVPILRDADGLTFAEIERRIVDFSERAREGKMGIDELTGGTFTISNGGVYGSMLSTPILNPPQSAILGLHRIIDRPVAAGGQVVIRPMMYLALSYDHRLIDGREAVLFLVEIKQALEDPARLLLQI
ncbi:MAG: 2-oxoglutarate dehydrogenase complex dihydrolipoyllysine-residue succinyltransferase [Burkholderiales bacterium]